MVSHLFSILWLCAPVLLAVLLLAALAIAIGKYNRRSRLRLDLVQADQADTLQRLALVTEQRDVALQERLELSCRIAELREESGRLQKEQREFPFLKEAADVNDIIAALLKEFELMQAAGSKIHRVRIKFEPAPGNACILLDYYLFGRIFFHLLSHAVESTPADAEVYVRVKLDNGRLSLSVQCGGFRLPLPEMSRPLCSTNQVLAIVKRLAEIHGGSVMIHSKSSGGLTVVVNIEAPAAATESQLPIGLSLSRAMMRADAGAENISLAQAGHDEPERRYIAAEAELEKLMGELQNTRQHVLAAAEAKSQFLTNISHEIRTPLNGLIVTSELLLQSGLTIAQSEYMHLCRESAFALLDTINDLLDFTSMEEQQLNLELLRFDVLALVEGTAQLLADRAQSKGISLMTYICPELPRWLCGDPARLRQILINIIGNGIKFTDSGEVICRVAVENHTSSQVLLKFVVADTGIGLSAENAKILFEPFTQAETGTLRKYQGNGIGLSIARRLIELMGGEIGVGIGGTDGRGATFWFTIPFAHDPVEYDSDDSDVPAPAAYFASSLRNIRLLVIDAHVGSQRIIVDYARGWGLDCTAVATGKEGLALLKEGFAEKQPFDLVLIDFDIADANPLALARYIRRSQLNSCRLLLMTAGNEEGRGLRALKQGFQAYMTKPVRQSDLFDCLANLALCAQLHLGSAVRESLGAAGAAGVRWSALGGGKASAPGLAPRRERGLVLVVEDNTVNQRVARLQLEEFGYCVDVVNNGAQALDALQQFDYDVVLMDCAMPVMDGYEATRQIRKMDALTGKHTKIIAITAHSMAGDREKCLACGMDDYLSKPVNAVQLQEALSRCLNQTCNISS